MGHKKYVNPFQAFTTVYSDKVNRVITDAMIFEPFDPVVGPIESTKSVKIKVLWDTGATNSVVTKETVSNLGLIPTGTVNVSHAGGDGMSSTYVVNIILPNNVGITGTIVTECENINNNFGAIIGMDIISLGDFSISNFESRTVASFRIPSYRHTDFVHEANKIKFTGCKPYAPCPCGAKDKFGKPIPFNKCHGLSIVDRK